MGKRLRRARPLNSDRMSMQRIAEHLAESGHVNEHGIVRGSLIHVGPPQDASALPRASARQCGIALEGCGTFARFGFLLVPALRY